jgi:hypothetical protein
LDSVRVVVITFFTIACSLELFTGQIDKGLSFFFLKLNFKHRGQATLLWSG